MKLIQMWKNRETKAKLREENIRLKATVDALDRTIKPNICTVERNIQRIGASYRVYHFEKETPPEEYIKKSITEEMAEYLAPFVEWNFENDKSGNMIYRGTLYVATSKTN